MQTLFIVRAHASFVDGASTIIRTDTLSDVDAQRLLFAELALVVRREPDLGEGPALGEDELGKEHGGNNSRYDRVGEESKIQTRAKM